MKIECPGYYSNQERFPLLVLFCSLIAIFIHIDVSLRHGAVVQHQQLVVVAYFVCKITSECNSKDDINNGKDGQFYNPQGSDLSWNFKAAGRH